MAEFAARYTAPVQTYQQQRVAGQGGGAAPARVARITALLTQGTPDRGHETRSRVNSLKRWRNVSVGFSVAFAMVAGWCVYRRCRLPGGNPFKPSYFTHKNVLWWTLGAFAAGALSVGTGAFGLNRHLKKGRYLDLESAKVQRQVQRRARSRSFTDFREWVSSKKMIAYAAEVPVDGDRMVQYDLFQVQPGAARSETYCAVKDLWTCSENGAAIHQREVDDAHLQFTRDTRQIEDQHQRWATQIHHRQATAAYAGGQARRSMDTGTRMIDRGRQSDSAFGKVLNYGVGGAAAADGLVRGVEASVEGHRAAVEAHREANEYHRLRRPHEERRKNRLATEAADYGRFCHFVNTEARRLVP